MDWNRYSVGLAGGWAVVTGGCGRCGCGVVGDFGMAAGTSEDDVAAGVSWAAVAVRGVSFDGCAGR